MPWERGVKAGPALPWHPGALLQAEGRGAVLRVGPHCSQRPGFSPEKQKRERLVTLQTPGLVAEAQPRSPPAVPREQSLVPVKGSVQIRPGAEKGPWHEWPADSGGPRVAWLRGRGATALVLGEH